MLDLIDKPFVYFPPKPHPVISPIGRMYNKYIYMPGKKHLIKSVSHSNWEEIKALRADRNNRFLFLPNHPSHSDPQIIMESLRRIGISTHYLASYDLFLRRTKFERWAMQKSGAFSIDRESFNAKPLNHAVHTIKTGRYALTIFPEGRPYLQNDLVTPFQNGAVYIGLAAQKALRHEGKRVFLIPAAIKLTHMEDCLALLKNMLGVLAADIGYECDSSEDPVQMTESVAKALMQWGLRSLGYPETAEDNLEAMRTRAAEMIIHNLEKETGVTGIEDKSLWERALDIRTGIHKLMLFPEKNPHRVRASVMRARKVITAMKLLSYSLDYLRARPSLDRFGEIVERLIEDKQSHAIPPYGNRAVYVKYGKPIDLSAVSDLGKKGQGQLMDTLSFQAQAAAQVMIDEINSGNTYPGGRLIQR